MDVLSYAVSGCSCTGEPGDPGDGNGSTANPGDGNGNGAFPTVGPNGSIVVEGSIAGGVVVTLLIVAMVTGAAVIGILVWRRKQSVRALAICKYICLYMAHLPLYI